MSKKKFVLILICISLAALSACFLLFTGDDDRRFTLFAQELFRQEANSNTLTLHYTLKSPSDYQIHNSTLSLGTVSADAESFGAAAENALARLKDYNFYQLSDENQLIYKLLENTFSSAQAMAPYTLYEEPLSPLTGTQAQLPVLLSEYQFYSSKDVNIYLKLLKETLKYFQSIAEFESTKAAQGLFMSKSRADSVIEECDEFIQLGTSNYLYTTFENRLKGLDLSSKEYISYVEENDTCIREYVYPAYEFLKKTLWELSSNSQSSSDGGLCQFPQGKSYYELLVKELTGSDRSIIELKGMTYTQIKQDIAAMHSALSSDDLTEQTTADFSDSSPTSLLSLLKKKMSGTFPSPADVNISVKYVDASMEDYLSPAFYLIPAIDNFRENVIYINPAHMSDDLTLFTTLAHEGYPGHLYQTTYFANQNPAPIRYLLGCGGYTEGWATYCEMMSYYLAPIEKSDAVLMQKNTSVMLGLYSLADIGIHYEGWTLTDTVDFFVDYGITDADAISEIYELIVGDPANYLKYYIGYVEFLELKKEAIAAWGEDFTQERFHREILEAGSVPFGILREELGLQKR